MSQRYQHSQHKLGVLLSSVCALFVFALSSHAQASCTTTITAVPYTITQPGTYCLNGNKNYLPTTNSTTSAVTIAADNVILDLNRYEIRGSYSFYGPSANREYGVSVTNYAQNVTIRNGALVGFRSGIVVWTNTGSNNVGNLVVDNMSIRSMSDYGILVGLNSRCDNCTVQNSSISNTDANLCTICGGYAGAYAIRMEYSDNIHILNNVITGIRSRGTLPSYGISITHGTTALIDGNRVSGLANSPTDDRGVTGYLYNDMTVTNNHFSYLYYGIWYFYSNGGYSGNTMYSVTVPYKGGTAL